MGLKWKLRMRWKFHHDGSGGRGCAVLRRERERED
jgi:hypothetical protein